MFNIGGMELLVIGLVALVVLGPDKLPGAVRQVGHVVGELRRLSQGFQTDLRGALTEAERDAEASRRASAAGPSPDDPDPAAAQAAAEVELAALEGSSAPAERSGPSGRTVGSEGDTVEDERSNTNP